MKNGSEGPHDLDAVDGAADLVGQLPVVPDANRHVVQIAVDDGDSRDQAILARPAYQLRDGGIVAIAGPQPRALYAGLTYNVGRLWK